MYLLTFWTSLCFQTCHLSWRNLSVRWITGSPLQLLLSSVSLSAFTYSAPTSNFKFCSRFSVSPHQKRCSRPPVPTNSLSSKPIQSPPSILNELATSPSSSSCSSGSSTPSSSPPKKFRRVSEILQHTHPCPLPQSLAVELSDDVLHEPSSYSEAKSYSHWHSAMDDEYQALLQNQTWNLVPLASHVNVVGSKWVFKVKRQADGMVERHKARLVAKGYHQQHGVDFEETFSPMIKHSSIRTILSLATMFQWRLHQLDVRNAFLQSYLTEEVFMHQPPRFKDASQPDHLCQLNRALYGLNQAPRVWFHRL